jgi:hypothetical protein
MDKSTKVILGVGVAAGAGWVLVRALRWQQTQQVAAKQINANAKASGGAPAVPSLYSLKSAIRDVVTDPKKLVPGNLAVQVPAPGKLMAEANGVQDDLTYFY